MTHEQVGKDFYTKFYEGLNQNNKNQCLDLSLKALENGSISIPYLYEEILEKSLYEIASNESPQSISIWQEHVQSGIIRTIIENTYAYVLKFKEQSLNQKVIVLCPEEEFHDIGARMTSDFLTLLGFESYFIGPNTPAEEIFKAIDVLSPDWVSISVTNFFHLSKLQDLVLEIKAYRPENPLKVMVGGYAIENTPGAKEKIQADAYPHTFVDLKKTKEAYYETSL